MNLFLDLDGTIVDPAPRYHAVYTTALARCGDEPVLDVEAYWAHKRRRTPESEILTTHHPAVDAAAYNRHRMALIEAPQMLALDPLLPGADDALTALGARATLYLVTMRRAREALITQLGNLGIARHFAEILSRDPGSDAGAAKVDLIAGVVRPGDWVVGDTEADSNAGKTLSLSTCAVTSGIRTEAYLRGLDPDHIVGGIAELPRLVGTAG